MKRSGMNDEEAAPGRRHRRRAQEVRGGGAQAPRARRADRAVGRGHGEPHLHEEGARQDHAARRRAHRGARLLRRGRLRGIGYNVQTLDCPTNEALQFGKEFGNRGQCNPTYFTVGNLVKYLCTLRDKHGMSRQGDRRRTTSSSPPARAARAASACTSPSTGRRSATRASTASASSSSSRRAASSRPPATRAASS